MSENIQPELGTSEKTGRKKRVLQNKYPEYQAIGDCPICEGRVENARKTYRCRNCDFEFRKNKLRSLGRTEITVLEMQTLLRGELILLCGLRSGEREPFDVGGSLSWDDKSGWGIEFCKRPRISSPLVRIQRKKKQTKV